MPASGSTSPTHYYASRRNSRDTSRPNSPPSSAEVRSQAIAKLKRAASLPRTPAGKRPPPVDTGNAEAGPSTLTPTYASLANRAASPTPAEVQEVLSPSPVSDQFAHGNYYPSPQVTPSGYPPSAFDQYGMGGGMMMQRSASASSSYHMPTPPLYGAYQSSPFYGSPQQNPPDWAAMQLAQSYLPSLSPGGLPVPNFNPHNPPHQPGGRNTPSPLPSLGDLRNLQRSNSAAARAHAMSKLTGGRDTPSDEGHTMKRMPSHPGLQRADTLGPQAQRSLGMTQPAKEDETAAEPEVALPRPRLQRSFTVSSSNMGEERRSAVGRRMVARLGERRQARKEEEDEVRRLWEERRAAADHRDQEGGDEEGADHEDDVQNHDEGEAQEDLDETDSTADHRDIPQDVLPVAQQSSTPHHTDGQPTVQSSNELLGVPDRPVSRSSTMRSADSAFEYEAHLRRSLSSRTARGAVGTVTEAVPRNEEAPVEVEHIHDQSIHQALEPLTLPRPPYATPTRHTPNSSTSTDGTIHGQSPGDSIMSRDGLGSMMFVMGGNGAADTSAFPSEVGENSGSDWGTPAKEQNPVFNDSPLGRSPLTQQSGQVPNAMLQHSPHHSSGGSTPPGDSRRTSVMSWEEVGGPEDQSVPSDTRYHKKSGSISAKLGRNIRTAMRKRSQSRSSASSSTEGATNSPLSIAIANFGRRESESSLSPSQASAVRSFARGSTPGDVKHQPSISSLSPSIATQPESSPNSALLQHQLSSEPSPVQWLPRAALHDPRIHSSKLSPFPGIVALGEKGNTLPDPPKLMHQTSDSAVPSQHTVNAPVESIYSLPLPPTSPESRRASDDSVGKRSWLAKAFGQTTSPRSSGGISRQSSSTGISRQASSGENASIHVRKPSEDASTMEIDPFAGPLPAGKPGRHRSASPSVSVVPEGSEEGSRLTRFTAHTQRMEHSGSPAIEEEHAEEKPEAKSAPVFLGEPVALPNKSKEILRRMDDLLELGPDDPARPDILDDPPRKMLLSTQILQVVNAHTAKDRYLFLFNDILVIAKPIINVGTIATLDMKFLVKWVVSLDKLVVSGFEEEPTTEPPRHAVVQRFIEQFAEDPVAACKFLVERSNPRVDAVTLASLIFKTPELDRSQIGNLLAGNDRLMRAFLDRFHFSGIRIDDALRMFLLAIRLPAELNAVETLLRGFANRYYEANRDVISYTREIAEDLVLWMMQLNDSMYGICSGALPNHAITLDLVISAFQPKDPQHLVHPSLLSDIYTSLKTARIDQALSSDQETKYGRQVTMVPSRLPSKLTYDTWSEEIAIQIPERDDKFQLRLHGEGLEFEPELLDFGRGREQKFRVRGSSLGTKSILFDRCGPNAPIYASLGNTRTITVERSFMKHTFQVAFTSHTGLKRKYCFSVADAAVRQRWAIALQKQTAGTRAARDGTTNHPRAAVRRAAEMVSLQVLRDALIPPESKEDKAARGIIGRPQRSGSVSVLLKPFNEQSAEGQKQKTNGAEKQGDGHGEHGEHGHGHGHAEEEHTNGMVEVRNGKELVLLCRQNSLLPGVLELLQSGLPPSDATSSPGMVEDRSHRNEPPAMASMVNGNGRMGAGLERGMSKRVGGGRV